MTLAKQLKINPVQELDIFNDLCAELKEWNIESVAEEADLCHSTLYNWLDGSRTGRLENIIKVGHVLGMQLQWVKTNDKSKKKPKLSVVK